jgi:hypothetical protein
MRKFHAKVIALDPEQCKFSRDILGVYACSESESKDIATDIFENTTKEPRVIAIKCEEVKSEICVRVIDSTEENPVKGEVISDREVNWRVENDNFHMEGKSPFDSELYYLLQQFYNMGYKLTKFEII